MDAKKLQRLWPDYLEDRLNKEEKAKVETFLEGCSEAEIPDVVGAEMRQFLRAKLSPEPVPARLEARVHSQLAALDRPRPDAPAPTAWYQRFFADPRVPRWAMAAVLLLAVLIPVRALFRAPALAQEVVDRHQYHVSQASLVRPACCENLHWQVGEHLPSIGITVPDLRGDGLELAGTMRCSYGGTMVEALVYKDQQEATFSLYITGDFTEEFRSLSRKVERDGILQVSHTISEDRVSMWEKAGKIYCWVGREGVLYRSALNDLQAP